jgi:spermidine synthase
VEIEAAVPAAAEFFMSENNGVLAAPRYRLVLDDARSWLRVSPLHYDAIVTDCTNIQYRSNGDLYTVDYFRLLRDRLTPTGIAAAWVPANGIREADLKTLLRSFKAVFPHTSVWYMDSLATDFLIVVGTPGPLAIDMPTLARRMAAPAVLEDLTAIGLADPARLLYTFLLGDGRLDEYLGQGPTNTDDRPVLSYSTYGATFENTIPANLIGLVASREDVAPYVHGTAADGSMLRHLAASNEIILGHVHCQRGQPGAALPHYLKAAEYLPNDACMPRLIRSTLVQLHWSQPAEGVPLAAPMGN